MNHIYTHMRLMIAPLIATVLVAAATGCAEIPADVLKEASHNSEDFLIGPEDVLEVVVWHNEDLTREVVVRPDGMIALPLIGALQASGRTTDQLAEQIQERLREFKESPRVSVHLMAVNSYNIYVLGEVSAPGKFQLKSYSTVLHAIALAGGFTEFASRNKMQVIRNTPNGKGERREIHMPVRYDDLLAGTGQPGNFVLKSGDIVVVP